MTCLFGYCGDPAPDLLGEMAATLEHRCPNGWERTSLEMTGGRRLEVGHGRAAWSNGSQVFRDPVRRHAFAYAGTLFSPAIAAVPGPAGDPDGPPDRVPLSREEMTSLKGAFVAAWADPERMVLVRDGAGVKVVYWTRHKGRLLFASEIKALFADPAVARRLRHASLAEYLTFSFVPGAHTMFADIFELQPGSSLTYAADRVRIHRHFVVEELEGDETAPADDGDHVARMRDALTRSVAACLNAGRAAPAVFLSGGIDSSAVLAMAVTLRPAERIRTFSVHFGPKYANENDFVSLMVDRYRTDHTWLEIKPKRFLNRIREIIWKLDDPIGDPITVPNFMLAEAAARVTGTVLNGEGGDPCFGGPKNIPMMLSRLYGPFPDDPEEGWLARHYLISYRKCFNDLPQLLDPDIWRMTGGEAALMEILTPFFSAPKPARFLNKLMGINMRLKGANLILVKVEKMTAANGILALPPLFSEEMMRISMACPTRLKLRGATEKWILKQAVADLVPREIIDRPKSGMMVPVRFWLRKDMRWYARRLLSKRNLNRVGFFNTDYVRKLLAYDKSDVRGSRHGLKLWMIITFMLWYEQMVASPNRGKSG